MNLYEHDIIAWANQQSLLLRMGRFADLDLDRLIEEIEDVGKSERRELASRMAVLLAHLLKWAYQPERRRASWQRTIKEQRRAIAARLRETPSLKTSLADSNWKESVWADAVARATEDTGLDIFPDDCPWPFSTALNADFYP